jgi:hypothetical protein
MITWFGLGVVVTAILALWALPMVASWLIDEVLNAGVNNDESH